MGARSLRRPGFSSLAAAFWSQRAAQRLASCLRMRPSRTSLAVLFSSGDGLELKPQFLVRPPLPLLEDELVGGGAQGEGELPQRLECRLRSAGVVAVDLGPNGARPETPRDRRSAPSEATDVEPSSGGANERFSLPHAVGPEPSRRLQMGNATGRFMAHPPPQPVPSCERGDRSHARG